MGSDMVNWRIRSSVKDIHQIRPDAQKNIIMRFGRKCALSFMRNIFQVTANKISQWKKPRLLPSMTLYPMQLAEEVANIILQLQVSFLIQGIAHRRFGR